jgi:hypothetical protein
MHKPEFAISNFLSFQHSIFDCCLRNSKKIEWAEIAREMRHDYFNVKVFLLG